MVAVEPVRLELVQRPEKTVLYLRLVLKGREKALFAVDQQLLSHRYYDVTI